MAAKQGSTTTKQLPTAAAGDFDLIDNVDSYVLRLDLQGFKKDDFRVQVDSAGKLTVRGQRAVGTDGKHAQPRSFHKVFQLPPDGSLDDISGRFEAGVLTLTVPKRAAAPTAIEELKKPKLATKEEGAAACKPPSKDQVDGAKQQKDDGAEKKDATPVVVKPREEITKDADLKKKEESFEKAMDEAARKVQRRQQEAKRREQEQKQTLTSPLMKAGDGVKAKAPEAPTEKGEKPGVAGEKAKAIEQGSLVERVRQRAEEERAKAVVKEAEREKTTEYGGWKERVAGELEELADMKWVDGLVEMARNNKEVVAAAIAAFSLGFLVSQKFFSRK